MNEKNTQTTALVILLVAAAAFFYFGSEILSKHTAWTDFQTPAGVGEIFGLLASVIGAVAAALKVDVPALAARLRNAKE